MDTLEGYVISNNERLKQRGERGRHRSHLKDARWGAACHHKCGSDTPGIVEPENGV